jgi:kynurenine formamidase
MYLLLSHKLNETTPTYNNGPTLKITPVKRISNGDSSNDSMVQMPNHIGTHVDAPKHFDNQGPSIADFGLEELIFRRPTLIQMQKGESELIRSGDLSGLREVLRDADLALVKTGFQRFRESDRLLYSTRNPGFSEDAAKYIRDEFPNLRAVGFDFISLSAVQHRSEGRAAHGILLRGRRFLIIEDMDLSNCSSAPRSIFVLPLRMEGVDSAPCSVLGEF